MYLPIQFKFWEAIVVGDKTREFRKASSKYQSGLAKFICVERMEDFGVTLTAEKNVMTRTLVDSEGYPVEDDTEFLLGTAHLASLGTDPTIFEESGDINEDGYSHIAYFEDDAYGEEAIHLPSLKFVDTHYKNKIIEVFGITEVKHAKPKMFISPLDPARPLCVTIKCNAALNHEKWVQRGFDIIEQRKVK